MKYDNMKILLRITAAKIKRNLKKSIFQSVAVLVSMFVISFFLCFILSLEAFSTANPTFGIEAAGGESLQTIDSLKKFFKVIVSGISFIAGAVIILSVFSLFIYVRMRKEENRQFYATLASIGATGAQRQTVSVTEALILYAPPIILGSFLGTVPSSAFTRAVTRLFVSEYSGANASPLVAIFLSIIGILITIIFTCAPILKRKKSIIEDIKSHNKKEASEAHNYRKSYTFRHMPIEQRIAKKSVAYYADAYRRITFMFISCVMYPLLAVLFFIIVSQASVTDYTSGYGIDTAKLIGIFGTNIAIFGALAFLALTAFGAFQTVYIIQAQNKVRKETLNIYKSIGMTENSVKKVLKYEYRTVAFHTAVYLAFILTILFVVINSSFL